LQKRMTKQEAQRLRAEGKIVAWVPAKDIVIESLLWLTIPTVIIVIWYLASPPAVTRDYISMALMALIWCGFSVLVAVDNATTCFIIDQDGVTEQRFFQKQYLRWSDCKFVGSSTVPRGLHHTLLLITPLSKDEYADNAYRTISEKADRYYGDKGISIPTVYLCSTGLDTPDIIALWEWYRDKEGAC